MGGESSMSTVESGLELPTGTENELLRIRGAQLCLIDGEESAIIQSGDFAFHVIKQTQSPLAAAVALVGDLQWPVGKDSPALKVGNRKYSFALPGLLYGLVLPGTAPVEAIQSLEGLLQQYSTFEMHPEISDGVENSKPGWLVPARQPATEYWTAVVPEIEKFSTKIARKIYGGSPYLWSDVEVGANVSGADKTSKLAVVGANMGRDPADDHVISPRMTKRVQQARRMSAVAKLLSKTLLRGAINANRHVAGGQYLGDSNPSPNSLMGMAVAGVDAFARVVEAVETAGRSILEGAASGSALQGPELQQQNSSKSKLDFHDSQTTLGDSGFWTLNKSGLRLLLRAAAASAVIHVARGIGASSLSSTLSSPQSGLSHEGSIPMDQTTPVDDKEKYSRLPAAQFIPTPNSDAVVQGSDSVCSASGSARPPSTVRGPHRPNSPFQQYSRPTDQPQSHFQFSLGIDTNNRQHHQPNM